MTGVLYVTSEAHPLIKTGGLGDVSGSLPVALKARGCDIRVLMPAYRDTLARIAKPRLLTSLAIPGAAAPVRILATTLPDTRVPVWLVDHPPAYDRPGNPYLDPLGEPWADNAQRYALLARVATAIALNRAGLDWRPDVVHAHDWQAGLVPALLNLELVRPATVFTIHNLAYQGLFPYSSLHRLGLPGHWWSPEALEFYGQLSFIKGGLVYADAITTVSPSYAREIQTPEYGYGLDGLLRHRSAVLHGIVNGIDDRVWNPARDDALTEPYNSRRLTGKLTGKLALQRELGLAEDSDTPLLVLVGRLVAQKGVDLVIDAVPELMTLPVQLAILGSGDKSYEARLRALAGLYPGRIATHIGYSEALAHRIEAGGDMFLMPSRFEPCGLNQLYSLRYGTVPIVRRVGGLADTVVDANAVALADGSATGFSFDDATAGALLTAVSRALELYRQPPAWKRLQRTGMRQDFSWRRSADRYLELYSSLTASGVDTAASATSAP